MNKLLILAYNEEKAIKKTISELIEDFDEVIVVNDKSKDNTLIELNNLKSTYKKLNIITNKKNLGPGKSMEVGVREALKTSFDFLVKIDGDNQFDPKDIKLMLSKAKKYNSDFIKCDRFWIGGVKGKIPKIRYLGNAFASFLIKIVSSNWKINDPLNGLFLFSYQLSTHFYIPKFFNRYGYPFFINAFVSTLSIENKLNLHQIKNKVTYGEESSNLNPITVFIKLILFSIYYFLINIKVKLKYSNFQLSGLIDILTITSLILFNFSLIMALNIRFFSYDGNQGAWSIIFVIFFVNFFVLLFQSQKLLKIENDKKFIYLN